MPWLMVRPPPLSSILKSHPEPHMALCQAQCIAAQDRI